MSQGLPEPTTRPVASILVTEDDPQHALLITAGLKAAKLANPILVFDDGESAVSFLEGEGEYADRARYPLPVLALLDLFLPGMSGLDIHAWMKSQPGLQDIPAVILTASEEASDIDQAFSAGVSSYLIKPVGFEALLDVIRDLELHWVLTDKARTEPVTESVRPGLQQV